MWRTQTIILVPKKLHRSGLNDFQPIALISVKCLEKTSFKFHPSTYQTTSGPSPVCLPIQEGDWGCCGIPPSLLLQQLESPLGFIRILFIDFSSAFNIHQHQLIRKLVQLSVPWLASTGFTAFSPTGRKPPEWAPQHLLPSHQQWGIPPGPCPQPLHTLHWRLHQTRFFAGCGRCPKPRFWVYGQHVKVHPPTHKVTLVIFH